MKRPEYNWKLPEAIAERLGSESYGAQRAIFEDAHLLLVLHEPPRTGGHQREHAVFLRRPDGKWLYHGREQGEAALAHLLDAYRKLLDDLDKRYERTQDADDVFAVLDALIPVARAANNLRESLQAARDLVREDALLIDMRDRAVDVARGLELLLADARLALDYRLARNAEEQARVALAINRAQHKLNVIAALTFPLFTLAALFGMNLHNGLEGQPWPVFWAVLGAGVALGMLVKGWVTARDAQPAKPTSARAPLRAGSPTKR